MRAGSLPHPETAGYISVLVAQRGSSVSEDVGLSLINERFGSGRTVQSQVMWRIISSDRSPTLRLRAPLLVTLRSTYMLTLSGEGAAVVVRSPVGLNEY